VLEKVYGKVVIPNHQSSFEGDEVIGVANSPNFGEVHVPLLLVD